eukprot:209587_1
MSFPRIIPYTIPTLIIDKIIICICLCHNLSLFVKIAYDNHKTTELPSTSKYRNQLYGITMLTIASFFVFNMSQLFAAFDYMYDSLTCRTVTIISITMYCFGIYLTWLFSLLRIRIVFYRQSSSTFSNVGYSGNFLKLIFFCVSIDIFALLFCIIFIITAKEQQIPNTTAKYCEVNYKQGTFVHGIIFGILQSAPTLGCFYLFYRKMKLLEVNIFQKIPIACQSSQSLGSSTGTQVVIHDISDVKQTENNNELEKRIPKQADFELVYVVRKYAVLSGAAIVSSWCIIFFVMFTSVSFSAVAFDTVMNCWCIALFDKRYDNIYKKIFRCVAFAKRIRMSKIEMEMGSIQSHTNDTIKSNDV